jgi:histidyl-tRNA synthetase
MLKIKYVINDKIVRGLDYYTDTVFEFTTNKLGTQSALIAGGRYDGLFRIMGGKDLPAVGLGIGIDRLIALCEKTYLSTAHKAIFVFVLDERCSSYGLEVTQLLRNKGVASVLEVCKDSKKAIKRALESRAQFVIFVGESEMHSKTLRLRNLAARTEQTLPLAELLTSLTQT